MQLTSIRKIKHKYPNPHRGNGSGDTDYCVGGAFCLMVGKGPSFPSNLEIRDALYALRNIDRYALAEQDDEVAFELCSEITALNDKGMFDESWKKLDMLLKWKPGVAEHRKREGR